MPKNKTHSSAKKRYKVTGTGRIMRDQANNQHYFEKKATTRTRRLSADAELSKGDAKKVKRLLGL